MQEVTPHQLSILHHALWVDQYGRGKMYRDHFAAGPDDEHVCRELIALGYMRQVATTRLFPDFNCRVTDEGRSAVRQQSPVPPKLSRSKQRYDAFLNHDSGLKFGEWLRCYGNKVTL